MLPNQENILNPIEYNGPMSVRSMDSGIDSIRGMNWNIVSFFSLVEKLTYPKKLLSFIARTCAVAKRDCNYTFSNPELDVQNNLVYFILL